MIEANLEAELKNVQQKRFIGSGLTRQTVANERLASAEEKEEVI